MGKFEASVFIVSSSSLVAHFDNCYEFSYVSLTIPTPKTTQKSVCLPHEAAMNNYEN